jgi:hypothetical protein
MKKFQLAARADAGLRPRRQPNGLPVQQIVKTPYAALQIETQSGSQSTLLSHESQWFYTRA